MFGMAWLYLAVSFTAPQALAKAPTRLRPSPACIRPSWPAGPAPGPYSPSTLANPIEAASMPRGLETRFQGAAHAPRGAEFFPTPPPRGPSDDLAARLSMRLALQAQPNTEEAEALQDTVRRLLESPTARSLAQEFLAQDAPATVSFEPLGDLRLFEHDGRRALGGVIAKTSHSGGAVSVRLTRHFLRQGRHFLARQLPGILGHELLGHGLKGLQAAQAGIWSAYHDSRENETHALLVGWAIDLELGVWPINGNPRQLIADPEGYYRNLQLFHPYYAVTLNLEKMADPVPVLQARLTEVRGKLQAANAAGQELPLWREVIAHFILKHGVPRESFRLLLSALDYNLRTRLPRRRQTLRQVAEELEGRIRWYASPPGAMAARLLAQAYRHPFFAGIEERMRRLRDQVQTLLASQPPGEGARPGPSGQVTWDRLKEMWRQDQEKCPGHYAVGRRLSL